jgi:hypothetical protein
VLVAVEPQQGKQSRGWSARVESQNPNHEAEAARPITQSAVRPITQSAGSRRIVQGYSRYQHMYNIKS